VIVLSIFLRDFTVAALGPIDAVLAVALILTIAMSAATVFIFYAFRKPVARLIRTAFGSGGKEGGVVAFAASNWHIAYAAITVLSDSISFANEIGLSTGVSGTGYSLQVFVIVPFLLAALVVVREHYLTEAGNTRKSLIVGIAGLAQGALIVGAGILLLVSWGIDAFSPEGSGFEKLVATAVTSLLSIVCGVAVWRAAATLFDLHAPATAGDSSTPMDEDGGHKAASRFTTVYPVLRGFVLISIVAITAMIALSAFGVEIGPLIAGAGVVGIAVGFGAQTLVKDIISGIFYLQEDAFRVGEYISTSQGKGIVEKISLRSVRLRHHRGPVYTIPFGSMGTVENLSRDWVKIKFSFVVSSDQDLELIRKVVKKIGAALEEDPELEGKFLEPLKSQGAVGMNGPNYEIGVKFTCRPGEQFLIRRKAYVALQKALEEQGIELFQPKVVVSSATSPTEAAAAAMAQAPSN
jgi:small-conductance mechanosensitive channel